MFGEFFFLVSVSHETKHEKSSKNSGKIRSKIRGKIRNENSKKFGKLSFCNFWDLNLSRKCAQKRSFCNAIRFRHKLMELFVKRERVNLRHIASFSVRERQVVTIGSWQQMWLCKASLRTETPNRENTYQQCAY